METNASSQADFHSFSQNISSIILCCLSAVRYTENRVRARSSAGITDGSGKKKRKSEGGSPVKERIIIKEEIIKEEIMSKSPSKKSKKDKKEKKEHREHRDDGHEKKEKKHKKDKH